MLKLDVLTRSDSELAKLTRRLQGGFPTAMKAISLAMHADVMDCFRQQRSPYGVPWAPLAASTLRVRQPGGRRAQTRRQILIDTGALRNAIVPSSTSTTATLTVGGPAAQYASTHQLGRGNVPARPFLPVVQQGGRLVTRLPDDLRAEAIAMLKADIQRR